MVTDRLATRSDVPALADLMRQAIDALQKGFLSPAEIAASRAVMGLDTQLIDDGTYFVLLDGATIVGSGGWSRRATLYGGDHSGALREPTLLDPATDAARLRAMYTHPAHARRGIGRRIVELSEDAARAAGFKRMELMATLAGEPLYRRCGYEEVERVFATGRDGVRVPLVRMGKGL